MRIMLVQDDQETAAYVRRGLKEAGHVVDSLTNGLEALAHGRGSFDVMIIDRRLPGLDGLSLVKGFRATGISTPVLFLTAASGIAERVEALEAGGDDYLAKPFAFSELLARLVALGRRPRQQKERTLLKVADLEMDLLRRTCHRASTLIHLLPREAMLLEYLMLNEGRVLSRTMLLDRIWDVHFDPQTSVVETQISRLRAKIDRPFERSLIHTVRQTGYTLYA